MQTRFALFALGPLIAASPLTGQARFGVVAGGVSATVSATNNTAFSVSSLTGLAAGISLRTRLAHNVSLAPEALFVMKGAKETLIAAPTTTATTRANYLEVPVLVRVMLGDGTMRPFLMGGPQASFKLSCQTTVAGAGPGFDGTSDCNKSTDNTSGITSTDVGLMIGAGIAGDRLSVSIRYDLGLVNIVRDQSAGAVTAKNRAFMAMVGIAL